jgi:hypothetical protein
MADKRLVYRKYSSFFCEKQMKLLTSWQYLLLQETSFAGLSSLMHVCWLALLDASCGT